MEKHVSEPSAKHFPLKKIDDYGPVSSRAKSADKESEKPSREDISRCISIWARVYRLQDEALDARELCLPAQPWTGRNPNSLKRFD